MEYYVVDAFTDEVFGGNPAGVCVLDKQLTDEIMQKIAAENNLSETAFVLKGENRYKLRWFTPKFEIDLCGHATLATAFVIFNFVSPDADIIKFDTMSGVLTVCKKGDKLEMVFPNRKPKEIEVTEKMKELLKITPKQAFSDRDLYLVLDNEQQVLDFVPDYDALSKLDDWLGIVLTAKGENCDFVSRYFCPELKLEDPVTGSSHSSLIPLWAEKLGKETMKAMQLSQRRGTLYCENGEQQVKISGKAALYLKGNIKL